jgi:hypothetical protein
MVNISDTASQEIGKVLQTDQAQGKSLIVNFMGYG